MAIVVFPEISTTKLKIPPHVVSPHVVLQESVILCDMYKNIWPIKARKVNGYWYLLDGWAKFVADSSVTAMDLLSFNFSGPGSLDVNILCPNGDMKKGVGYRMVHNPKEHQNLESDESEDVDTFERVSSGKNNKLLNYSSAKTKDKRGKKVLKYQDVTGEYEADDDFSQDGEQGHWDGEGDDETEESDGFEFVYRQIGKCKEVPKELRKSKNDNNASGSRKPQQKKRNVDSLSKSKRSYSVKRMKPLYRSNKGKGIWNHVSEEDEEGNSEEESIELTRRNERKGKGRVKKELRADAWTSGSGFPFRKRRNIDDDCCGNKIGTSRLASRPKIHSSEAKRPPQQTNGMDNRGKGILKESSDKDSGSDDGADDPYDVEAPKSSMGGKRVGYLGNEIFESGVIPRPECIYFVKKVKPRRMNEWHIPKDILDNEDLDLPETILLADPNGNAYTSRLKSWADGRRMYKGGINRLCRRNHLTEDDFCICEFGEGNLTGYLFVSFVRKAH